MSGIVNFWASHIPQKGELVWVAVGGKSFPTGVWKGVLTDIRNIPGTVDASTDAGSFHAPCTAIIIDEDAPFSFKDEEPKGSYDAYPDAPGMVILRNKLNDQKEEVKALKKRISDAGKILVRDHRSCGADAVF